MKALLSAYFMTVDFSIFDVENNLPTVVQSSNLNEELGMIHYVFSDKTGTLTQNVMEFQKISIGPYQYGVDKPSGVNYALGVTNVNFQDPNFVEDLRDTSQF